MYVTYIYSIIYTYLSQVKHENKDASIYILEVAGGFLSDSRSPRMLN